MKKILFSLFACVCVLLAVTQILPATPVNAAGDSALIGASLYLDDKVDLVFCFDPDIIATKKAQGTAFTFSISYKNKTYTEKDLKSQKDSNTGEVYQTITVGPFTAVERTEIISYSGSMTESGSFSLTSLAKSGINYYSKQQDNDDNKRILHMLKSFVNYSISVDNIVNEKNEKLPYTNNYSTPVFTADPGTDTPLATGRVLTGRSFIFADDVYVRYQGTVSTKGETKNWVITLNSVDVTEDAELTENGSIFTFKVPIEADQGQDKLRILIKDKSGNVIYDCIDRADALALQMGEEFPEYTQLSHSLAYYLQSVSNYSKNPVLDPERIYESGKYYAGFGRADITPYCDPTELNTSGTDSNEFLEGIFASCVALRDTKGTVSLIFSIDVRNIQDYSIKNVGVPYTLMKKAAKEAASAAGFTITDDQIFFIATHNHNAPSVTSTDETVVAWYNNLFFPGVTEATRKAIQDLAVVEGTYTATGITEDGTNYNRRYVRNAGSTTIRDYEDEADKELRTIRFVREGAKDILLVNWQAHAANVHNAAKGTADFVGTLRATLEKDLNVHFFYVNGASGDLNMYKHPNLDNDKQTFYNSSTGKANYIGVGNSVAGTVKTALGKEKSVTLGDIKISTLTTNTTKNGYTTDLTTSDGRLYLQHRKHVDGTYCMTLNTYTNTSVINCQQCYGIYQMIVNAGNYSTKGEYVGVNEKGASVTYQYYKYSGTYSDRTITSTGITTSGGTTYYRFKAFECAKHFTCAKDQYSQYSNLPVEFNMWTMTMGDSIGFAFCPYEMFSQNGVDLRNEVGSDKFVMTAGYTNGYVGYIASEVAFQKVEDNRGGADGDDGTFEVYSTKYKKGCAEYFQTLMSDSLKNQFAK